MIGLYLLMAKAKGWLRISNGYGSHSGVCALEVVQDLTQREDRDRPEQKGEENYPLCVNNACFSRFD